ncbi:hypothetical protein LOTGIDRAFT_154924 [Lottia gigantea]|uniref:Peptidase M4 C-terminal domain-containing protein n=1 Tax=Lottia gigantea TaxID=225164 RepID=V3ZWW2_LOTGI|nr:hypothetical protein LOTGIDRAFT_154924 [Lottia gigantea]ESO85431.1 hypothetical protein LOTGIDRAFT_154924 [Lottia gigantea]
MELFVLTLWFGILIVSTEAAIKVDPRTRLRRCFSNSFRNRRRSVEDDKPISLREVLDFEKKLDFSPQNIFKSSQGNTIIKFKETVNGKNVFDGEVTAMLDKNGVGIDVSGLFFEDINAKELNDQRKISITEAFKLAKQIHGHTGEKIHRFSHELDIFIGNDSISHLAYFIDYFVVVQNIPQRPITVVDSKDGKILLKFNNLETCKYSKTIYGGNRKLGRIPYSHFFNCQNVDREGNMCSLENEFVRVIDMNSTVNDSITESATFRCNETYIDSVNGAYSPAFDAFFYGTTIARMLHEWYDVTPKRRPLLLRVHYSKNLTDAFWDGRYCSFGDSEKNKFYPMVSMDIVAHEIGHSITEQYSNLLYMGESGGINEAFSDMMGETAEYYVGMLDWMVGYYVTRQQKALRYFDDPTMDNRSITHIRDYYEGMDTHSSSGIFRKVFYDLVKRHHIPIKKVFQVFLHANQIYWHKMSSFVSAACDVMKAALDLGTWVNRFAKAFRQVGIEGCNVEEHIFWLRSDEVYSDIYVSEDTKPLFGFSAPPWARKILIETMGDVTIDITLYHAGLLSEEYYILKSDINFLEYDINGSEGSHYFIQLGSSQEEVTLGVRIRVRYECVEVYKTEDILNYLNYQKDCKKGRFFVSQKLF